MSRAESVPQQGTPQTRFVFWGNFYFTGSFLGCSHGGEHVIFACCERILTFNFCISYMRRNHPTFCHSEPRSGEEPAGCWGAAGAWYRAQSVWGVPRWGHALCTGQADSSPLKRFGMTGLFFGESFILQVHFWDIHTVASTAYSPAVNAF